MNYFNTLLAAAGDTPPEANWASTLLSFSPFLLLIVAFYFFMLRPQKKQQKEMQNMLNSIGTGDVIVTSGGIVGVVVKVKDDMMLIESSADRTKIQIQKRAVHSVLSKAGEDTSEKN